MAERSWTRKLTFSLLTAVLLLGTVEALLRVLTAQVGRASIPADDVARHIQSEGLNYDKVYGWVRAELPAAHANIDINGFRHVDPVTKVKSEGGWRAFTMGDSQTYGAGVQADQTYTAFAERALRRDHPGRSIEVINTGLSGYGSLQALRLIQHKLLDWDPDLLIVDCRSYDQPRDGLSPQGQLDGLERLLFHYRTYYVLRFAVDRLRGKVRPMGGQPMGVRQDGQPILDAGNHDVIMQVAQDAGVPVIFLDYPFWDPRPEHRSQAITCLAEPAELPQGAVAVSICQPLRDSGLPPAELFLDNNHMAIAGNTVAGEALAAGIADLGLLD